MNSTLVAIVVMVVGVVGIFSLIFYFAKDAKGEAKGKAVAKDDLAEQAAVVGEQARVMGEMAKAVPRGGKLLELIRKRSAHNEEPKP